jgi:hypothetical protein
MSFDKLSTGKHVNGALVGLPVGDYEGVFIGDEMAHSSNIPSVAEKDRSSELWSGMKSSVHLSDFSSAPTTGLLSVV